MTYDAASRIVTSTSGSTATKFTFDGAGNQILQSSAGSLTTYSFDPENRNTKIQYPNGTISTYDRYGNPTTQINSDGGVVTKTFDILGRTLTSQDPIGRTTSYAYDPGDNLISMTTADGATWQYLYLSCLLQAQIDPLGNRTSYTYGRFNNQLTMQNPLGFVWTNLYDNTGYLTGTIDPLGNQTSIIYNAAKQKIADVDQLGFYTTYSYDSSARPLATKNARGFAATNVWNARDIATRARSTAYTYSLASPTQYTDPSGRRTGVHQVGLPYPNFGRGVVGVPNYGNYCGALTTCTDGTPPTDCLDKGCAVHDACMDGIPGKGKTTESIIFEGEKCNCALAASATYCYYVGCGFSFSCRITAGLVADFMGTLCVLGADPTQCHYESF